MAIHTYRWTDHHNESALCDFLDEYFYERLASQGLSYERISDRRRQLAGIDVIVHSQFHDYKIDEKATLHYANQMIPTFAFEISSIQGQGIERNGWFTNKSLETDFYMLLWPNVKRIDNATTTNSMQPSTLSKTDFSIVEGLLISRLRLQRHVEKQGWTCEALKAKAAELRAEDKHGRVPINSSDMYLFCTPNLAEKPINLVIRRKVLLNLATNAYLIAEDGMADITHSN
ncbi:hypothetical protein [Bifidobacterium sp.]|uniref:hypothetical protein n=1 Tax=Bifidobacterium sp. TaxID=41200 RepID=UPI0039E77B20